MNTTISSSNNTISFNGSRSVKLIKVVGLNGLDFATSPVSFKVCRYYCDGRTDFAPSVPLINLIEYPSQHRNTAVIDINQLIRNENLKTEIVFEHLGSGSLELSYGKLLDVYEANIGNIASILEHLKCIKNHKDNKGRKWHINMFEEKDYNSMVPELIELNNVWVYTGGIDALMPLASFLLEAGFIGNLPADMRLWDKYKYLYVYSD